MPTWRLRDADPIAAEPPYAFYKPSRELIGRIKPGESVKLIFDFLAWTTKRISRKKGCDAIRGADRALYASGVRGGVPTIVFDAATASIHCTIRYESASSLSEHEREVLRGFSNGQLVDGFGSNPIDVPSLGDGYFVHLGDE